MSTTEFIPGDMETTAPPARRRSTAVKVVVAALVGTTLLAGAVTSGVVIWQQRQDLSATRAALADTQASLDGTKRTLARTDSELTAAKSEKAATQKRLDEMTLCADGIIGSYREWLYDLRYLSRYSLDEAIPHCKAGRIDTSDLAAA